MKIDPLAQSLDDEFKRVSRAEDIAMSDLVSDVAILTNHSARQIYNYRSGRWPIPAQIIPVICRRFKSTSLLSALRGQVSESGWSFSESLCNNMAERAMDVLKQIVEHHSLLVNRIESSAVFDAGDLLRLEESTERIVQGERELFAYAEMEYERRLRERRRA